MPITARVMRWRLPCLGYAHEAWPGFTISGIVTPAAAMIADAFGEAPRGGPRLHVGLALGIAVPILGYVMRRFERRDRGDGDAP